MAEQENPGLINTVMSYIPGYGSQTTETTENKPGNNNTSGVDPDTADDNSSGARRGKASGYGQETGSNEDTLAHGTDTGKGGKSFDYGTTTGTGTDNSGYGTKTGKPRDSSDYGTSTGKGYAKTNQTGNYETNKGADYGTGSTNKGLNTESGYGTGSGTRHSKGPLSSSQKANAHDDDADETGTHHSGYNPRGASSQGQSDQQQQQSQANDDGVRGAPIEGDNVKGYAIGAPVGSGDTEKPNQPGDPSGQVSGAHLEYGPKETDTRDNSGRGTVENSQGQGDSSFANVKTDDGGGNYSHVMTRTNESHMHSSSVTQM